MICEACGEDSPVRITGDLPCCTACSPEGMGPREYVVEIQLDDGVLTTTFCNMGKPWGSLINAALSHYYPPPPQKPWWKRIFRR